MKGSFALALLTTLPSVVFSPFRTGGDFFFDFLAGGLVKGSGRFGRLGLRLRVREEGPAEDGDLGFGLGLWARAMVFGYNQGQLCRGLLLYPFPLPNPDPYPT